MQQSNEACTSSSNRRSRVCQVYIWNVDTQPERKEDAKVQGSAASQPDLVLTGHVQDAKFAMAFHAREPRLISGGEQAAGHKLRVGMVCNYLERQT